MADEQQSAADVDPGTAPPRARGAGLSFMEIIVAFSVIALLAGVLTPMFGNVIDDSKRTKAAEECRAIADAIGAYRVDHGDYPPGKQDDPTYSYANQAYFNFGADVLNEWLFRGAKKYLQQPIGLDPWGQPYNYHVYTRSDPYMDVAVFSNGPNQQCESWDGNLWNRGRFGGDDIGAFFDQGK
jgi:type II secretory pathway pseudopilin PulG